MRQRYAFFHKGCAVYALHFNAYMDLKSFMRQARYAASQRTHGAQEDPTALPQHCHSVLSTTL